MQSDRNRRSAGVSFEGLEQRRCLSGTPAMPFDPPAFGKAFGMPPIVFDAAFAGMRGTPVSSTPDMSTDTPDFTGSGVRAATNTVAAATPETFNGYPSTATDAPSASVSLETVYRAVDGGFVPTGSAPPVILTDESQTDATSTTAALRPVAIAAESSTSMARQLSAIPDVHIATPVQQFSSQPIRSNASVVGDNAITAGLRSAERQFACLIRLAWADIPYTNVVESIGRFATEAGQMLTSHAGDAELAAAVVMGVAGAAWWVKQTDEDIAAPPARQKRSWIETIYPRPLAG